MPFTRHQFITNAILGIGSFCTVYEAVHVDTDRVYALKEVPKAMLSRAEQRRNRSVQMQNGTNGSLTTNQQHLNQLGAAVMREKQLLMMIAEHCSQNASTKDETAQYQIIRDNRIQTERQSAKAFSLSLLTYFSEHVIDSLCKQHGIDWNHNIIRLYGTFQTPESLCFVMERCNAGDLLCAFATVDGCVESKEPLHSEHSESTKLSRHQIIASGQLLSIIRQIHHAIQYLHNQHCIIHRDIKPENILLHSIQVGKEHNTDYALANSHSTYNHPSNEHF